MPDGLRRFIVDRWRVLRRVYWHPLWASIVITYAVVAAVSTLVSELAPPWLQKDLRLGDHIPHLSGWEWATIGLVLLFVVGVEGATREFRRLESGSVRSFSALAQVAANPVTGPQQVRRKEVDITPEQLTGFFRDVTDLQGQNRVARYIGGLITVSGPLREASKISPTDALVYFDDRSIFSYNDVKMRFREKRWVDILARMDRGAHLIAKGQIENVDRQTVHLDYCELLRTAPSHRRFGLLWSRK